MTDMFEEHAQAFAELSAAVTAIIGSQVKKTQGPQKSKAVQECQAKLSEINEVVDQMEFEAREQSSKDVKAKLLRRVDAYRAEVSNLEKELRKAAVAFTEANREELIDVQNMDLDDLTGSDQRQLLLRNTERLHQTGRRIEEAERQTLEIQEIGIGVMENLANQRDTIVRAKETLRETDSNLRKSMRVANSMARRIWQNKLIMYGIMVFAVLAIAAIIYLKFGR
eukprot:comp6124_c0_seq1/m.1961 comp6124_c0_seq1/g.1961  ORF comp6124_c0_seq1/g.1961 comp6124_c0_seq1/m.1961 type:complete len:224 (-) comp6124_c0_seq1:106-777(-)